MKIFEDILNDFNKAMIEANLKTKPLGKKESCRDCDKLDFLDRNGRCEDCEADYLEEKREEYEAGIL